MRSRSVRYVGGREMVRRQSTKQAAAALKKQIKTMNADARAFWTRESGLFLERVERRPEDLQIATDVFHRRLQQMNAAFGPDVGTRAIRASESLEQIVADLARSHAAVNSRMSKVASDASRAKRKERTADRDVKIRARARDGVGAKSIADEFKLSVPSIYKILNHDHD